MSKKTGSSLIQAPILIAAISLASCVPGNKFSIKFDDPTVLQLNSSISSVKIENNQFIIKGSSLTDITDVKLVGNNSTQPLVIESVSSNELIANGVSAISIGIDKAFSLVLSNAHSSTTIPVTFTLDNGSVTAAHLNRMGAQAGQILKFNGSTSRWEPANLSNSQVYLGSYDADRDIPQLAGSNPSAGNYYIVSEDGTYNSISYVVGDWIIYNGTAWEKVVNTSGTKLSLSGGHLTGDLSLDTLLKFKGNANYVTLKASSSLATDLTLTLPATAGTNGQVLTTNGSGVLSWSTPAVSGASGSAGGDLSGSYPNPTISALPATKIADGSVTNAQFQYLSGVTSNIQSQLDAKQVGGNFLTALTGDVTASGPGSAAATVVQVGGVSAADIASAVGTTSSAATANTASTIIKRDSSGNFSAGTITATLNGTATNVSGTVAVANGGTGATTLGLNQLLFGNSTSAIGSLANPGSLPSVLLSSVTTGAPTWTTSTGGNVLKGSASGVAFGPLALSDLPSSVISGTSTNNYVPYFSATSTIVKSPISVSGNYVGIGKATPVSVLDVYDGTFATFTRTAGVGTGQLASASYGLAGNSTSAGNGPSMLFFADNSGATKSFIGRVSAVWENGIAGSEAGAIVFSTRANSADSTASSERLRISANGNVGIGSTAGTYSKLAVSGAIVSVPFAPPAATVDLSQSNTHVLSTVGGSAITLTNPAHGGTYTLVVTDTNPRMYTFTGCTTAKFKPGNATTTNGTPTIYTILILSNGGGYDCYINWSTGYQ